MRRTVVAILTLLMSVASWAGIAAAQQGGASLTIHARWCPEGFAGPDYDGTCHDSPLEPASGFSLEGAAARSGQTDTDGNVVFSGLPTGSYRIVGGPPEDWADAHLACTAEAAPGVSVGPPLYLNPGDGIVCDLYFTPITYRTELPPTPTPEAEPGVAALTVHNRYCPVGFAGPDYYGACHGNAQITGLRFELEGAQIERAMTDATGNATFTELNAGAYTVLGGPSADVADLDAFCAPAASPGVPFPFALTVDGDGIELELGAGDDVVCDWYSTPSGAGTDGLAAITMRGFTCPPGYEGDDFAAACGGNLRELEEFDVRVDEPSAGVTHLLAFYGPATVAVPVTGHGYVIERSFMPGGARDGMGCETDEGEPLATVVAGSGVAIGGLAAGDHTTCGWYVVPAPLTEGGVAFPMVAYVCDEDPGGVGIAMARELEGCTGATGVAFSVALQNGAPLGSCVSDTRGGCTLPMPFGSTVVVTEDVATVPAGYAPRSNPVTGVVYTEFAAAIFVNLPADAGRGPTGVSPRA